MGKNRLTTLGSLGWIPVRNRHTCCYCLEYHDTLILFDAGTGLARFAEPWGRRILEHYHKILLLLSHYHLDHTAGLIYLPCFFKEKQVHIAGPGHSIYGRSVKEILSGLITPPYFSRPLMEFPMDLTFHDLGTGSARIAGIDIDTLLQEHSDPSIGIKVDNRVCYMTDTAVNRSTVDFVRHSRLLLHETWLDHREYEDLLGQSRQSPAPPQVLKLLASHSPVSRVAEIAEKALVRELLLIHLNPGYSEARLLNLERQAQAIFQGAILAQDGQTTSLD